MVAGVLHMEGSFSIGPSMAQPLPPHLGTVAAAS